MMQPIFNLLSGALAALDTTIASAAPDADATTPVFSDELGLRILSPTESPSPGGNLLPQFGNSLPTGQPLANAHSEIHGENHGDVHGGVHGDVQSDVRSDVRSDVLSDVQGDDHGNRSADPEHIIASLQQQLRALQDSSAAEPASGSGRLVPSHELADNDDAAAVDPLVLNPPATDIEGQVIAAPASAAASTNDSTAAVAAVAAQAHAAPAAANTLAPAVRRSVQDSELLSERVSTGLDSLARDLRPERTTPDVVRAVTSADSSQKPPIPPEQTKPVEPPIVAGNSEDAVSKPQFTVSAGTPQVAPDIAMILTPSGRVSVEAPLIAPLPTTTLHAGVQEPGWGDAFAEKITLMANNKLQAAEIRLTPADLGPLRVRLTIEDGAASISFAAQHAVTRDAIEQALPRLREMLAENGLSLERASVGEDGVAQGHRDDERHARSGADAHLGDEPELEITPDMVDQTRRPRTADGLVDTFV